MSEELRPCPFCGGTNICTEKGINLNYCDSCSAEANIEHWNTRPIEDALHARIAELEAAQRWIPVSERLPECDKDVLVFWGKALDGSTIDWFGTAWRNSCDSGNWCTDPITPTHWMLLPSAPESEE